MTGLLDLSPNRFESGSVRCLFNADVDSARLNLPSCVAEFTQGARLVTLTLARFGPLESLFDGFVESLAEAALLLWPDWYAGAVPIDAGANLSEQALTDRFATRRIAQTARSVNAVWLKGALSACRAGRAPVQPQFSPATQVEQLSLALAESELVIAVCAEETAVPPDRLLGFARAVEWLAREAGAHVLAILPAPLADRPELDGISFGASRLGLTEPERRVGGDEQDERKHVVCPILGRPHPGSPGEQRLAEELARDAQLGALFQFNQRVITVFENRFLVDLLWTEGQVVVEIDGYGYHTTPSAFVADRQRDYELTFSGYLVLRLPHDFVVEDPRLALERIRDFVRFRRERPSIGSEVRP